MEGTGNWSAEYEVDSGGGCPKWPDQMSRYITVSELGGCSCWELRILRNEIYARHGRKFKSKDLQDYFAGQPWYSIDPNNLNGDKGQNEYEKKNTATILNEERGRGCR
ncbi:MAG: YARHG domain-containing protein [Deltaproteobacteria bacterium]|uniref:YARHG domain-containing protein n=1 Tax=Candidatus Zymogenus saltonus TaxID=2844893 RepID=A0A9D8PRW4_9DELT|nr:YARHG domain-containing protein [Candidatus Zymogenus saltonus]